MNQTVLLMYSGGKDSFLSACKLVEQGYKLKLITYNNDCTIRSPNEYAERLIKCYSADKIEYLRTHYTTSLFREFFIPYFNIPTSEIIREFGEITISQLNCLLCRTSMYIYSIILCKKMNISIIAEGARKSQLFVIELEGMIERYKSLLNQHGINLLLPVYNLISDWDRENELMWRGFIPQTIEDQCMLGVPLNNSVSKEVINGIHTFYDKVILPKIIEKGLIEKELYGKVECYV